jgi:hypothetical protein
MAQPPLLPLSLSSRPDSPVRISSQARCSRACASPGRPSLVFFPSLLSCTGPRSCRKTQATAHRTQLSRSTPCRSAVGMVHVHRTGPVKKRMTRSPSFLSSPEPLPSPLCICSPLTSVRILGAAETKPRSFHSHRRRTDGPELVRLRHVVDAAASIPLRLSLYSLFPCVPRYPS